MGEKPTERQEGPDPYIERPQLVAEYKYLGRTLVGVEVYARVVNRGGAGPVEVVFMMADNQMVDRELIY